MAHGQSKAISLQGMVHNATKIGVQDGQCEDLVNLRFKDGAWRSTGDGKIVFSESDAYVGQTDAYTHMYIHTNVYRHLLGRGRDGMLYWFALIDKDGNIFNGRNEEADTETHREARDIFWDDEHQRCVSVPLCLVSEDAHLSQTGNLLTIIEGHSFKFFLYKSFDKSYNQMLSNGNVDRNFSGVFPYRRNVKFNFQGGDHGDYVYECEYEVEKDEAKKTALSGMIEAFGSMKHRNKFTRPFLVVAACELYDGSYAFATAPQYIFPSERYSRESNSSRDANYTGLSAIVQNALSGDSGYRRIESRVLGYDLFVTFEDTSDILKNKDIISAVCIFVTEEADYIDLTYDKNVYEKIKFSNDDEASGITHPVIVNDNDIVDSLLNSGFFLLKRYDVNELQNNATIRIDLSSNSEKEILDNIVHQDRLTIEAFSRKQYVPKICYSYNGKLHIANYDVIPYEGFPINSFCWNNHSVQVGGLTETPLREYFDNGTNVYSRVQYDRKAYKLPDVGYEGTHFKAYVYTEIETESGTQSVINYIDTEEGYNIKDNLIEDLSPIIMYPDSRAKKMIFSFVGFYQGNSETQNVTSGVSVYRKEIALKKHPTLDFAYFVNEDLKPITFDNVGFDGNKDLPDTNLASEIFPNGLKVSKVDNPMFFPVESTYQVGSSEIVAICSNAIAVGTGQTGQAPLYVFCKDGIYALFVDASGQMTYTNARVIARDVCNNAKSVTPIDDGVVFTTDRGLMIISGEQVQEIGQPLEGDIDKSSQESLGANLVLFNNYHHEKIAGLPDDSDVRVTFLEYLKGSIINYNHNDRELMVSNPSYSYSYIYDSSRQWSRRAYRADEYVKNYPTSYRVAAGEIYQVDKDTDSDNGVYIQSNVIKLDSIGFKEVHRLILRGYFETVGESCLRLITQGSYDGRRWATIGEKHKKGKFNDIGCNVSRTDCRFYRFSLAGKISKNSRFDFIEFSALPSHLDSKPR